jgi:hypothetical protein
MTQENGRRHERNENMRPCIHLMRHGPTYYDKYGVLDNLPKTGGSIFFLLQDLRFSQQ